MSGRRESDQEFDPRDPPYKSDAELRKEAKAKQREELKRREEARKSRIIDVESLVPVMSDNKIDLEYARCNLSPLEMVQAIVNGELTVKTIDELCTLLNELPGQNRVLNMSNRCVMAHLFCHKGNEHKGKCMTMRSRFLFTVKGKANHIQYVDNDMLEDEKLIWTPELFKEMFKKTLPGQDAEESLRIFASKTYEFGSRNRYTPKQPDSIASERPSKKSRTGKQREHVSGTRESRQNFSAASLGQEMERNEGFDIPQASVDEGVDHDDTQVPVSKELLSEPMPSFCVDGCVSRVKDYSCGMDDFLHAVKSVYPTAYHNENGDVCFVAEDFVVNVTCMVDVIKPLAKSLKKFERFNTCKTKSELFNAITKDTQLSNEFYDWFQKKCPFLQEISEEPSGDTTADLTYESFMNALSLEGSKSSDTSSLGADSGAAAPPDAGSGMASSSDTGSDAAPPPDAGPAAAPPPDAGPAAAPPPDAGPTAAPPPDAGAGASDASVDAIDARNPNATAAGTSSVSINSEGRQGSEPQRDGAAGSAGSPSRISGLSAMSESRPELESRPDCESVLTGAKRPNSNTADGSVCSPPATRGIGQADLSALAEYASGNPRVGEVLQRFNAELLAACEVQLKENKSLEEKNAAGRKQLEEKEADLRAREQRLTLLEKKLHDKEADLLAMESQLNADSILNQSEEESNATARRALDEREEKLSSREERLNEAEREFRTSRESASKSLDACLACLEAITGATDRNLDIVTAMNDQATRLNAMDKLLQSFSKEKLIHRLCAQVLPVVEEEERNSESEIAVDFTRQAEKILEVSASTLQCKIDTLLQREKDAKAEASRLDAEAAKLRAELKTLEDNKKQIESDIEKAASSLDKLKRKNAAESAAVDERIASVTERENKVKDVEKQNEQKQSELDAKLTEAEKDMKASKAMFQAYRVKNNGLKDKENDLDCREKKCQEREGILKLKENELTQRESRCQDREKKLDGLERDARASERGFDSILQFFRDHVASSNAGGADAGNGSEDHGLSMGPGSVDRRT